MARSAPSATRKPSTITPPKRGGAPRATDAAAALRARWTAAAARVTAARAREAAGWDELYEAIDEILEHKLYVAGGFRTTRAYLAHTLPDQDERTVRGYIRVARHFTAEHEASHGVSKLALLVDYLEAVHGGPLGRVPVAPERQTVVVPFGKAFKRVPFRGLSVDALRAAVRHARARGGGDDASGAVRQPAEVVALRRALRSAKLPHVGVARRGGLFSLSGIAQEELRALGRVLARITLA